MDDKRSSGLGKGGDATQKDTLSSSFYGIPEERSETICLDLPADTRYLILPSVVFAAPKSKQFKDAIIGGKGCTGTGAPWTVKSRF